MIPTTDSGFNPHVENVKQIILFSDECPRYYHERFLYIRHRDGGAPIPWRYNTAQKMFSKKFQSLVEARRPVRMVVLKARRVGISTLIEGECFRRTVTREGHSAKIVSHEKPSAHRIFEMNNLFYDKLPMELRPAMKYRSKGHFMFENPSSEMYMTDPGLGSQITLMTCKNAEGGRGEGNQYVHLSELAFYGKYAKTCLASVQSTMSSSPTTVSVIESTANGEGGEFYEKWREALYDENNEVDFGWTPVFIPWIVDKECSIPISEAQRQRIQETLTDEEKEIKERFKLTFEQLAWRRFTVKDKCSGSVEIFHQEFPVTWVEAFITTGKSCFNKEAIKHFSVMVNQREQSNPPKVGFLEGPELNLCHFYETPGANLKIWKMPEPGKLYFIGGDPCQGREGIEDPDSAVLEVFSEDFEQVAEYRAVVDPTVFAEEALRLGFFYNIAMLNIEVNTAWGEMLYIKRVYPNIYHWQRYEDHRPNRETPSLMFETTGKSVHFLRERLLWAINLYTHSGLKVYSPLLLREMKTFEWHPGTGVLEARSGEHDDAIVAMGMALIAMARFDLGYRGTKGTTGVIVPRPSVLGAIPTKSLADPMYGDWLTA